MKKIIILILLLVSVIGCIGQKAEQPLSTPTPQITEVTSTTTIATTDNRTLQANDTIPEINTIPVANSTPKTNGAAPKAAALTNNSDNSVPTQSVTNNDTEDNSTEDASLDTETEYGDNNEPPDEEPECYGTNGVDTPCPPDMV